MDKLTREEEATIDIEDDEEGEKISFTSKITANAEATITLSTTRVASYKEKIIYIEAVLKESKAELKKFGNNVDYVELKKFGDNVDNAELKKFDDDVKKAEPNLKTTTKSEITRITTDISMK